MKNEVNNSPESIQTPTTVEEFRSNLQKYFLTIQDSREDEHKLYLGGEVPPVPVSELNSLRDLLEIVQDFQNSSGGEVPEISPMVEQIVSFGDWYMDPKNIGGPTYFEVSENYRVYESQDEFLREGTPKWIQIDNQIYREFFYMTLGDFSGYQNKEEVVS